MREQIICLMSLRHWRASWSSMLSCYDQLKIGLCTNADEVYSQLRRRGFCMRLLHGQAWSCSLSGIQSINHAVVVLVKSSFPWPHANPTTQSSVPRSHPQCLSCRARFGKYLRHVRCDPAIMPVDVSTCHTAHNTVHPGNTRRLVGHWNVPESLCEASRDCKVQDKDN